MTSRKKGITQETYAYKQIHACLYMHTYMCVYVYTICVYHMYIHYFKIPTREIQTNTTYGRGKPYLYYMSSQFSTFTSSGKKFGVRS